MAVVIRLSRHGSRHNPQYRVVAADKRRSRDGRFLEILGTFDLKKKALKINKERVEHWISQGAKPSETVSQLISKSA